MEISIIESNDKVTKFKIPQHHLGGKSVVLGFGSIIWDPRELAAELAGGFHQRGPHLPLSFSRVSQDGRLTLVTDTQRGSLCQTHFAEFKSTHLNMNIKALRKREGTANHFIGYVDLINGTARCSTKDNNSEMLERIIQWAKQNHYSRVVWTELPSNFHQRIGLDPTPENIHNYLSNLGSEERKKAFDYILNAPQSVKNNAYPINLANFISNYTEQNTLKELISNIGNHYRQYRSQSVVKRFFSPKGRSARLEQLTRIQASNTLEQLKMTLLTIRDEINKEWHLCGKSSLKQAIDNTLLSLNENSVITWASRPLNGFN
jgi:hypothetical protein